MLLGDTPLGLTILARKVASIILSILLHLDRIIRSLAVLCSNSVRQ